MFNILRRETFEHRNLEKKHKIFTFSLRQKSSKIDYNNFLYRSNKDREYKMYILRALFSINLILYFTSKIKLNVLL